MELLAIDLGTTGVRAVCYGTESGEINSAYEPIESHYPKPGWLEQDPEEWFRKSLSVAQRAAAGIPVQGIGIVCQRGTAVAWDRDSGKALAPAIGWQDQRTLARVEELNGLGIPVNTLAACSKFEWLVQEVPAVYEAARRGVLALGTPDAWLTACFSQSSALITDPSNAGATGLLDNASGEWMDLAMQLFHQEPGWHMQVIPTDRVCGSTTLLTGHSEIPLAARAGDQQAACFAHGLAPGQAKLSLGTSGMLDVHTGSTFTEAPKGAYALPLWTLEGEPAQFCLEGSVITVGAVVEWLKRIGLLAQVEEFSAVPWNLHAKPFFLPALQGLGTPYAAHDLRASFSNLTLDSDRASLLQAVLSGLAQRACDLIEALDPDLSTVFLDGGVSRSDALCQAIADLSGKTIRQSKNPEMTALGAAGLAARGLGQENFHIQQNGLGSDSRNSVKYAEYQQKESMQDVNRVRQQWREMVSERVSQDASAEAVSEQTRS